MLGGHGGSSNDEWSYNDVLILTNNYGQPWSKNHLMLLSEVKYSSTCSTLQRIPIWSFGSMLKCVSQCIHPDTQIKRKYDCCHVHSLLNRWAESVCCLACDLLDASFVFLLKTWCRLRRTTGQTVPTAVLTDPFDVLTQADLNPWCNNELSCQATRLQFWL